ncbi:MAG: prepilin-type N-terminal cleavage/methylation domain-containing protein [Planctomycetota bacterium]
MKNNRISAGFTLIELLVVISIIALLAGIGIPTIMKSQLKAKEAMAKTEIAGLAGSLSLYENDNGRYPEDDADSSSKTLITALQGDATSNPPKPPYYQFKKSRIVDGEYNSTLNKPYHYQENASEKTKTTEMHNAFTFDIWTENGAEEKDKINNWD